MREHLKNCFKILLGLISALLISLPLAGQSISTDPLISAPSAQADFEPLTGLQFDVSSLPPGTFDADASDAGQAETPEHHGVVMKSVKRIVEDQKGIYKAPFRPRNFKWDALVLGGTALFLVEDHHIENNLPGGHYQLYQNISNIAIGGLSATLAGVWIYGIKTEHRHARETGFLELETLVNTFLVYTPMQLIAGRQRPGEGNGHGDFLQHHAINTSFPGGHAMFTWAMATVVAHEYSKPWIQILTYGAAFAVTTSRFLARDHWASDMWAGSALGIGIAAFTFHTHCDPELSDSCKHHVRFIF